MPNETITGKIYPVWNADKTERRFPQTVIEAVLGLPSYLQDQFSALADIYMPIEGITESKTGQEFVYRQSAATIKAKSLTLDRIYGKTLAWNQLVNQGSPKSFTGVRGTYIRDSEFGTFNVISGHKYYCSISGINTPVLYGLIKPSGSYTAYTTTHSSNNWIDTANASGAAAIWTYEVSGTSYTNVVCQVIDLTLMFGAGNEPSTAAEFEALYPGYHSYSAGKLISNDAESIETVGFNVWDEEWEVGEYELSNGSKINNSGVRCKNPIRVVPGTQYYFFCDKKQAINNYGMVFYDANGIYISGGISNTSLFTTPANAAYCAFFVPNSWYGSTYLNDICINLSDTNRNGTYEPYRKSTMPLNLNAIKVYSHNIWDEEYIRDKSWVTSTGEIKSDNGWSVNKNPIKVKPSTTYYYKGAWPNRRILFYDGNMNFLSFLSETGNGTFTTPDNAQYLNFYYATSFGDANCINLSSSFNGQYEPHGILTKTEGLKGKGEGRDVLYSNNRLDNKSKRINLGDLNWSYTSGANSRMVADLPGIKVVPNTTVGNLTCSKYVTDTAEHVYAHSKDGIICVHNSAQSIWIYDSAYTDAATFKSAMSGVYLDYELATPIEYELVEPLVYSMAAGTTEERISPNSDGLSAPFCCDMTYDANANNDSANAQYAATAGRLYNSHKLWGRDFDGSNDVSGALSGVTTIEASGNITTVAQLISTVATGTAPLSVASTTEVANLHSYTATKLHTQRTLWGQSFDGSGNVTGDMSSVGNIAFSASGKNIASLLYFDTTYSRVGVGASSPAYKLDVNGTLNASGNTTLRGTLDVRENTTIGGTFTVGTSSVNKATTLYGALTASGAVSFTSTLGVTGLSTLAGGIKLTTTKKIWFGDTYFIGLDANNHLYTNAGFYSTSFITAGGVGSGSGGGSNLVKEREYGISLTQITSSDYVELIHSPYINDSDSGFMFAYSPAFLDTASQMHDYVIDAIGHEIGSCNIEWIGIAIGSTYTDLGVFDSGAFLVLAKNGNTYYWYEFEV